jgi:hypothetical protein
LDEVEGIKDKSLKIKELPKTRDLKYKSLSPEKRKVPKGLSSF